jgi:DNA-binding transcriptional LysR family regulator
MVQEGIGVALMPEYTLPKQAVDISYRYLYEPEISRQVYAIYTQQPSAKPELQALIVNLSRT